MEFRAFHKELETLHVGCEEPRAYFIPFETETAALKGERDKSALLKNLCGEWSFRFYNSFEDVEENFLSLTPKDTIPVPHCWQTLLGRGYDVPLYSNLKYPFPLDPPFVPEDNPCGLYGKSFTLNDGFLSDEIYINFEGVSSCFYLFVNGEFAAYSQVSHCTSEINISRFLKIGENTVQVLVVKWCDGTYLEDQDFFRLSGIFREVYLLKRDKIHVSDVFIRQEVNDALDSAVISAEITLNSQESVSVGYKLLSVGGGLIKVGETLSQKIELTVDNPALWSAEEPQLYTLIISCGNEVMSFRIGLKRLEIKNAVVYLNGKAVKLFGINRHDTHPVTGYATDTEHMLRDLYIIKRANCNAIRTSHYPNDPRFPGFCDELGIMLVDEADIETHGMGFEYRDTWDWFRWSKLSTDDEWESAYIDRAKRLFERDKNRASIVMWSLGNESGCGKNHRAMANYIKSRDSGAIVHYENAHLEFKAVPVGENFSDISDVESRMYAGLDYVQQYLEQPQKKKPFYFCEIVDSATTGDIYAHCDLIDKYDSLFGACVWEFADHAVVAGEKNGKTMYRYGGDFGDMPNDGICCIDGLVFPDRTPRPGYYDMKRAYQPFRISMPETGKISVWSRNCFKNLDYLELLWDVKCNGKKVLDGRLENMFVNPRETAEFKLFDSGDVKLYGECYLTVRAVLKEDTAWAEKGYEIGFEQFEIKCKKCITALQHSAPKLKESKRYAEICSDSVTYVFDKSYGRLSEIIIGSKNVLSEPADIQIWKALNYSQLGLESTYASAGMDRIKQKTYSCVVETKQTHIEISCEISLGGESVVPVIKGKLTLRFFGDGSITMSFVGDKRESAPKLPRFGFRFVLDKAYENMSFFGFGGNEAYCERYLSCKKDLYEMKVADNFVPFIRPTENSAHYGSVFGAVKAADGSGFLFVPCSQDSFYFNASKYKTEQLCATKHNDELKEFDGTVVSVDSHHDCPGIKDSSKYPEREWDDRHIEFSVRLKPVFADDDLFEEALKSVDN